ncbi:MAG: serine hydrolase domain-containing protein [Thermoanaerobaculia bacterium]
MRALELLEDGIERGLHLGGQLAVALRGERVLDRAFGEARPGEAMRTDHLVLWLSASKPMTAIAVAQLWEKGLLDVEDPVARHIPEFGVHGKEAVTIRHLLTHTGGIRTVKTAWPEASWTETIAEICALKLEPRWTPGLKAGYHLASSWFVLAEIVRRLDGRPIERYLREELFEPLGMEDCWLGMPAERYAAYGPRVAPNWNTEESPPERHDWDSEPRVTRPNPGSNGRGPMRELLRVYEMLLGRGTLEGRRFLTPQTVDAVTAHQRVGLYDHTFRHVLDWGYGFVVDSSHYRDAGTPYGYGRHASPRTFGHSGYRSTAAFADPEHGLAVALAVNGTPAAEVHRERFERVLTALYEDLGLDVRASGRPG